MSTKIENESNAEKPEVERTTPKGLARYAYEYMDAAMIVDEAKGPQTLLSQASYTPAYYLAFHSIELSLKAYLLERGKSLEQLTKKYRHDLQKLYDIAKEEGLLEVFKEDQQDVDALHLLIDLNAENQLRYLQTGFKRFPLFSIVEPFGVRLHQAISESIGMRTFTHYYPNYSYFDAPTTMKQK